MRCIGVFLSLIALCAAQCTTTGYFCLDPNTYIQCTGTSLVGKWYCPECIVSSNQCDSIVPPISVHRFVAPNLPGMPSHNVEILPAGEPGTYELAISKVVKPWPTVWVPYSTSLHRVAKVSTASLKVAQIFYTTPTTIAASPSRTTVDLHGNVWIANREDNNCVYPGDGSVPYCGSATHIGLIEAGQCVDRNKNGRIDTSQNSSHILPWTATYSSEVYQGTPTYAADECILHYVRIPYAKGVRHVSITPDNNVWVGSYYNQNWGSDWKSFRKVNSVTGVLTDEYFYPTCGGYGGVTSSVGNVASSDFSKQVVMIYIPQKGYGCYSHYCYGLTLDKDGTFWGGWYNTLMRFHANGTRLATVAVAEGRVRIRGLACDKNRDIWVGLDEQNYVGRYNYTANKWYLYYLNPSYCSFPIGVSVDDQNRIWSPCYNSGGIGVIDPQFPPGHAKAIVYISLPYNAYPYTYSDMTGFISLNSMKPWGLWQFMVDGGVQCIDWVYFEWDDKIPKGAEMVSLAYWSETSVGLPPPNVPVVSREAVTIAHGRYMSFEMRLGASPGDLASPTLSTFIYHTRNYTLPLLSGITAAVSCNTVTLTLSLPSLTGKCGSWTGYSIYYRPGSGVTQLSATTTTKAFSGLLWDTDYVFYVGGIHSSAQISPTPYMVSAHTAKAGGACPCGHSQADCKNGSTFNADKCICTCINGYTGDWCTIPPVSMSSSSSSGPGNSTQHLDSSSLTP